MRKIFITALCAICLLLASCSLTDVRVRMDNPTDQQITVTLDGKKNYTLEPFECQDIPGVKKGNHTMSVNGAGEVSFDIESGSVVINPTLASYVIAKEEYGYGLMSSDGFVDIEIDGKVYSGPFELVAAQPVIDFDAINYDPATPFPDEITTSKTGTVEMYKLFRTEDFVKYYNEEYK